MGGVAAARADTLVYFCREEDLLRCHNHNSVLFLYRSFSIFLSVREPAAFFILFIGLNSVDDSVSLSSCPTTVKCWRSLTGTHLRIKLCRV
jgi:hypothetical protein